MPFSKDDPKTIAAAKKGGKTGKKHFSTLSSSQQRRLGKLSGKKRRELAEKRVLRRLDKRATEYQDKIMKTYLV